jgi:excinuclease ABC subunit C
MVRDILDVIYEVFPLRTCTRSMGRAYPRACLRYEIGLCPAPCIGKCTKEEYAEKLGNIISFLNGNTKDIVADLRSRMAGYSNAMQYEQAALMRDKLTRIELLGERQHAFSFSLEDRDAVAIAGAGLDILAQVLYIRSGRLVGSENYILDNALDEEREQVMQGFLLQHYDEGALIPKEILLESPCAQPEAVAKILGDIRGSAVSIHVPQRGEKKRLTELAKKNAEENARKRHDRLSRIHERTLGACEQLGKALGIPAPRRIECYDISNFQGDQSVGSMVVFIDGEPAKKEYRFFKLKLWKGRMTLPPWRRSWQGVFRATKAATLLFPACRIWC